MKNSKNKRSIKISLNSCHETRGINAYIFLYFASIILIEEPFFRPDVTECRISSIERKQKWLGKKYRERGIHRNRKFQ